MGAIISAFASWVATFIITKAFKVDFWYCTVLSTIVCFFYTTITDPQGAVNTFVNMIEDMTLGSLPSTPPQYTIYGMLQSFANAYPQVGWGPVFEIFSGIGGMLSIYLGIRLFRFLPFFGG